MRAHTRPFKPLSRQESVLHFWEKHAERQLILGMIVVLRAQTDSETMTCSECTHRTSDYLNKGRVAQKLPSAELAWKPEKSPVVRTTVFQTGIG